MTLGGVRPNYSPYKLIIRMLLLHKKCKVLIKAPLDCEPKTRRHQLTRAYINKLRETYTRATKQKNKIILQCNEGDNCSNDTVCRCVCAREAVYLTAY